MLKKVVGVIFWSFIISGLYVYSLPQNALLSSLYSKSSDIFFRYRYEKDHIDDAINKIVIINIDENVLSKLHHRWPLSRSLYADMLNRMCEDASRPTIVGLDLVFAGKSEEALDDKLMTEVMERSGNIIIASFIDEEGRLILPEEAFVNAAKGVGCISSPRDHDLVVRRAYINYFPGTPDVDGSFAFKIFSNIEDAARLKPIPTSALLPDGTIKINYFARFEDFNIIQFDKVLDPSFNRDVFKGKIVLIGTNMEIHHDIYSTPLGLIPGVAINANTLVTLLSGRFLRDIPAFVNWIILFLASLCVSLITYRINSVKGFICGIVMIALSFYAAAAFIMKDITADFFGLAFVVSISFIAMAVLRHLVVLVENARLGRLASTDGLTGLYHFRYFEVKLNSEVRAAKEAKADLSLVIFDIDHFKEINDNYGHDLGNEILRRVARAMRDYSRKSDTVARFGGDEFAAILPQAKLDDAYKFAESVKAALRNSGIVWNGKPLDVSISAGASALFINGSATAEDLIRFADRALYDAKSHRIDKRNMR